VNFPRHLSRTWRGILSLAILGLLAFTLRTVAFSDASFTAKSVTPANVFTAGTLLHSNSQSGQVAIAASDLTAGDSSTGTMTIAGTGNVSGVFTLNATDLVNTPSTPKLSDVLTLTVEDITHSPQTRYHGTVSAFTSAELGTIGAGETSTYRLTLAYPAGTVSASLQGSALTLDLLVTGVSQ